MNAFISLVFLAIVALAYADEFPCGTKPREPNKVPATCNFWCRKNGNWAKGKHTDGISCDFSGPSLGGGICKDGLCTYAPKQSSAPTYPQDEDDDQGADWDK
uniref:Putative secreted salivary gland protein n=1 Tax=Ornithodoros turicata TaxID=34597 RepID=A0A2R5LBD5_9ACAR